MPLPNSYGMRTPAGDVSRSRVQSWNISFERRLPWDLAVDMAYVGTAKNGGFTDIDANATDVIGGGRATQPLIQNGTGRSNSAAAVGTRGRSRGTTRCRSRSTGPSRTG